MIIGTEIQNTIDQELHVTSISQTTDAAITKADN
jgi:hypothetical protein